MPRNHGLQFLYLTTTGWRTGRARQVEVWFVEDKGRYYVVAELGARAHWVQNIQHRADVTVRLGNATFAAAARLVDRHAESKLAERISGLMQTKYEWTDEFIVELTPVKGAP